MKNCNSVLVTGGTGTFGKAFISRILETTSIERIIVFSRDEFKQFEMANIEPFKSNSHRLRFFIGDIRDKDRLKMACNSVDILIHAAALKQIVACEYNPFEAIKTNIFGAQNIIEASLNCNVKKVIALSTDKACSPSNLYGATKLCSDRLFMAAGNYSGGQNTKFAVVRYGNVAGSRGSIIPFFQSLIKSNAKTIPITDNSMTRFIIKIDQAVDMVLEVNDIMKGGELYIKKIPSARVTDIVEAIAPNLQTEVVGVRPGEKIHEMMISKEDAKTTIDIGKYYLIKPFNNANNYIGETVASDFEYHSGNNTDWLSVKDIKDLINSLK